MRKMKFVAMALTAALALQFTVPAFAAQLPETEAAPEQAATAEAPDEVQAEALEEENLIEFRTLVRYASNTHPSETVSVGLEAVSALFSAACTAASTARLSSSWPEMG